MQQCLCPKNPFKHHSPQTKKRCVLRFVDLVASRMLECKWCNRSKPRNIGGFPRPTTTVECGSALCVERAVLNTTSGSSEHLSLRSSAAQIQVQNHRCRLHLRGTSSKFETFSKAKLHQDRSCQPPIRWRRWGLSHLYCLF